ncbi:hypothetical protein Q5752_006492 [Cryptotrichosporon argae]
MPPREITVTYTLYPSGSADLLAAVAGIRGQLPLRNLHWKPQSRTSLRTIQEVDVRLLELGDVAPSKGHVAASLLEAPLVNLCLIACDDAEIYKNNVKNFVRDWLSLLSSRRSVQAPLIVLVSPPSAAGQSSKNVFGRDKGVIAKLRADFNTTKRDRCAQLNLSPVGTNDPTVWPEVINKLKESIVSAFGVAVYEREEEVKRGEAQRVTVGWNFCTWFLLKESLAHSFECVNLFEDALIVYEELEASFYQVLKEHNLAWFGKLGATGPSDDSLPVLDPAAKPYRVLLQSSTISIFDFRIYVFARQAYLLGKLGRVTEIAKRGQWFVASLARRLREHEADLAEHFIESWTYTACMDLVRHCDEWSQLERPNGDYSGLIAYESARAELLDIARIQVEHIGVAAQHLPNEYPFQPVTAAVLAADDVLFESSDAGSDIASPAPPAESRFRPKLSNPILVDALQDGPAYRALYLDLTRKAVTAYEACGKINSAIRLKADLAALALYTEEWQAAFDLSCALAKSCAELLIWDPVAKFALAGALTAHTELQLERDEQWANLALAYVRACALTNKADETALLPEVLAALRGLEAAHDVDAKPVFAVRLLSAEVGLTDDAGITQADVEIDNTLRTPVEVDVVEFVFVNRDGERITFASGPLSLVGGENRLSVSCATSTAGLFIVDEARVVLGQVVFTARFNTSEVPLRVRRNPDGLKTVLRMPYEISLDAQPTVVLELHGGKTGASSIRVDVASAVPGIQFDLAQTHVDVNAIVGQQIDIEEVGAGKTAVLTIPYIGQTHNDTASSQIHIEYDTPAGPRVYRDMQVVSTGLPLTVNVQDFFRPDCLISGFTIASDQHEHLHIGGIELSTAGGYGVERARAWDAPAVVAPYQPLSCLFKIKPAQAEPPAGVLRLAIRYRTIEEEVQLLARAALEHIAAPSTLQRAVRERLAGGDWMSEYLTTGDAASAFAGLDEAFLTALRGSNGGDLQWRTLEIPVDIPQRRLLTTVHLARPNVDAIHEGRALPLALTLTSSAQWASGDDVAGLDVVYELGASADDWLVVGKRKGTYRVDLARPEVRRVTLVPMRAGRLALPTVTVALAGGPAASASGPGAARHELERVLCETHVDNAADVVHVLPARAAHTTLVPVRPMGWVEAEA